jgi:hypothetical protein
VFGCVPEQQEEDVSLTHARTSLAVAGEDAQRDSSRLGRFTSLRSTSAVKRISPEMGAVGEPQQVTNTTDKVRTPRSLSAGPSRAKPIATSGIRIVRQLSNGTTPAVPIPASEPALSRIRRRTRSPCVLRSNDYSSEEQAERVKRLPSIFEKNIPCFNPHLCR